MTYNNVTKSLFLGTDVTVNDAETVIAKCSDPQVLFETLDDVSKRLELMQRNHSIRPQQDFDRNKDIYAKVNKLATVRLAVVCARKRSDNSESESTA